MITTGPRANLFLPGIIFSKSSSVGMPVLSNIVNPTPPLSRLFLHLSLSPYLRGYLSILLILLLTFYLVLDNYHIYIPSLSRHSNRQFDLPTWHCWPLRYRLHLRRY